MLSRVIAKNIGMFFEIQCTSWGTSLSNSGSTPLYKWPR